MGWENVLIGYKHGILNKEDMIPVDVKYVEPVYETRMVGWVSQLRPVQVLVGHRVLLPVYKKVNVKKK